MDRFKQICLMVMILISILLILDCASKINIIPRYESLSIVDFTKYSNKNFLITTEPYSGKYKSIGLLDFVVRCEVVKIPVTNEIGYTKEIWFKQPLDTQSLIDTLYIQATSLGGDAIMNFRMLPNSETYLINSEYVSSPGIEFTGFIIKRED